MRLTAANAIPPFFFHLRTRIVVFRQSLPIEGKSTGDVFVALSRDEPGQVTFTPVGALRLRHQEKPSPR
jgi:hypothetical protein